MLIQTEETPSIKPFRKAIAATVFLLTALAAAQEVSLDIHFGASAHPSNKLHIHQEGYAPTVITNARYETRAFSNFSSLPGLTENYYAIRLSYHPEKAQPNHWDTGIELELMHDKAYFLSGDDPEGVVGHFELSDGLNQALVNVARRYTLLPDDQMPEGRLQLIGRAGFGPVITAPATIIRGHESGTRSHMAPDVFFAVAGPGGQISAQARYFFTQFTALSLEVKGTIAHTRNPINGGTATATFYGAHINFGLTLRAH